MQPAKFREANSEFGPPSDLEESQVKKIYAFQGKQFGGSVDGADIVITAWQPNEEELRDLLAGGKIYLSCLGGLPPHFLSTSFEAAKSAC